jgi:hypothetical protein
MPYRPSTMPAFGSLDEVRDWVENELWQIAKQGGESGEATGAWLQPVHAEPEKPRDGMVAYADGDDWDPHSGVGLYARIEGIWVKL